MAHLRWTRDLDTGIDVIDGQHKQIVEYINQLFDARESRNMESIGRINSLFSLFHQEKKDINDAVQPYKCDRINAIRAFNGLWSNNNPDIRYG